MPQFEIYLLLLIGVILALIVYLIYQRKETWDMARELSTKMFEQQKENLRMSIEEMYEAKLKEWKVEYEEDFRRDALEKSRIVLKGKIGEQLAPIFKVFGHAPSDARFIGSPVDYVIFDGYTIVKERVKDKPITVVFADIKTGEAGLTYEQKRIKKAIEEGRVEWETIHI